MFKQKPDPFLPVTLSMKINKIFMEIEYFIRIMTILMVIMLDLFFFFIADRPYKIHLYSVDLLTLIGFSVMIIFIFTELIYHRKTINDFADQSHAYFPTLLGMGMCILLAFFTYTVMVINYFG